MDYGSSGTWWHDWSQYSRLTSSCCLAILDSALIKCYMRQIEWSSVRLIRVVNGVTYPHENLSSAKNVWSRVFEEAGLLYLIGELAETSLLSTPISPVPRLIPIQKLQPLEVHRLAMHWGGRPRGRGDFVCQLAEGGILGESWAGALLLSHGVHPWAPGRFCTCWVTISVTERAWH